MKYEKKINRGQDAICLEISLVNGKYQLDYLVLGRQNTTAAEKKAGLKKKRYAKEEACFYVDEITDNSLALIPSIELRESLDSPEVIVSIINEEGI